jgi:hypothetical protein
MFKCSYKENNLDHQQNFNLESIKKKENIFFHYTQDLILYIKNHIALKAYCSYLISSNVSHGSNDAREIDAQNIGYD